MTFLGDIVEWFNDLSDLFYEIYLEVYDWVSPFWHAAIFFYDLSRVANKLAWAFYDFANWCFEVVEALEDILTWNSIRSLIKSWLPNLEDAIYWFENWIYYVNREINLFWNSVQLTIQSWIDSAIAQTENLIAQVESQLSNLQSAWQNFTTTILPTLTNLTEVDNLISSWFTSFTPFWEGWLDWKDKVTEFFTDPLQWLYDKMDEWFERFW